jgi:hypothetical protein
MTVDAFPGERFDGTVGRISPIVSGGKLETRTADVWVFFSRRDVRLKPGMSADIEILITTLQNVLSVPTQAIIERSGSKQVYRAEDRTVPRGGTTKARLVPIEAGESNWVATEVRKGLVAGDVVITTPEADGLKEGARVRIEEDRAARSEP